MRNIASGRRLKATMAYHMALHDPEFTVSSLATAAGVERATIHDWWRGKTEPRASSLQAVADALDVPAASLVAAYNGSSGPTDVDAVSEAIAALEARQAGVEASLDDLAAAVGELAAAWRAGRSSAGVGQ